jgi:hypothetical protein
MAPGCCLSGLLFCWPPLYPTRLMVRVLEQRVTTDKRSSARRNTNTSSLDMALARLNEALSRWSSQGSGETCVRRRTGRSWFLRKLAPSFPLLIDGCGWCYRGAVGRRRQTKGARREGRVPRPTPRRPPGVARPPRHHPVPPRPR